MHPTGELARPSSVPVSGAVIVTAGLFLLTAWAGETTLVLALATAMVVVAWGWAGTLGLPTPRGTVGVLLIAGLAILISVYVPVQGSRMSWLPGALAVSIMVAFVHQLLRRDGRPRVAESVSSVVFALAVFTCSSFYLPLAVSRPGAFLIAAALLGVAVSALVAMVFRRLPARVGSWTVPVAVLVAGVLGGWLGAWSVVSWASLSVAAVLAAGVSHSVRHVFSVLPTMHHARPRTVAALTSVLMVGIVPYAVATAFYPGALVG